jgi:hypothetical protein
MVELFSQTYTRYSEPMLDILNRPTGWFWSERLVVRFITEFGLKLCCLFTVESPVMVIGWTLVAFVGLWDWISVQVYFIVVDQVVVLIHVSITHSSGVARVLLVRCSEISVLVRKYETKAQTYENSNDKSENELAIIEGF